MSITIPPVPTFTDPSLGTDPTVHDEAWHMLNAKYNDAWAWSEWSVRSMQLIYTDMEAKFGADSVSTYIEAIQTTIGEIEALTPPTISGGTGDFSNGNTALSALQAKIAANISGYSTGLGSEVEAAMFARETARVQAATAKAYNEITTSFSSRGFDMPPGALIAKQTEMAAESAQKLADSSGKILEESARLALDYNKSMLNAAIQLQDVLARVFESKESRAFEASKAAASLALESYKSKLALVSTKADIAIKTADLSISASARQLTLEMETLRSLAQGFQQMIASAINGVSASTSFGFSGNASTSYVGT